MTVFSDVIAEIRHDAVGGASCSSSVLASLRAVVAASECLVSESDLRRGVGAALGALRQHTGLDRICVFCDAPGASGVRLYGESLGPGVPGIHTLFGDRVFRDDEFPQVIPRLRAGEICQSIHPRRTGENAVFNPTLTTRSDLMVPVVVGGHFWGIVGFDDCKTEHLWDSAEVAALQGAASAIAAAVLRESAARARAEHAAALTMRDRLLSAVAQSMQALLGDEGSSFDDAVRATLGALGEACGIHRVKVIMQRPAPENGEPTHFLDHEWWAPGLASQTSLGLTRFPNSLIPEWTAVLERGRALWYLIDDVPIQLRAAFEAVGVRSVGSVPIFGAGEYLGLIAFDDCVAKRVWSDAEIDALTAAARTIGGAIRQHRLQQAMLEERDRRIELKRQRAEDAEAANAQLRRRDALLDAVARMSRELLQVGDWLQALPASLQRLGRAAGIQRVALLREVDGLPGCTEHRVVVEWCDDGVAKHQAVGIAAIPSKGATSFGTTLHAGHAVWSRVDELDEIVRDMFERQHIVSTGCVPIMVGGDYWGAITFNDCLHARAWDAAEIDSLSAAASAVAAAISRQQSEDARLTAEQLRTSDAEAVNRLLEGVVSASRALLQDDDLDGAMKGWLAHLATAVDADRAMYGDFPPHPPDGAVAAVHLDWTRPGLRCTQNDDIPASNDFLAWKERLARGETIWAHRDELLDPASVRYWQSTGCWTNLIVPVVVDQRTVGWLCFDFETRREWKPALGSVLRTAADAAAAAIKRRWAVRAMLAERDRRADESARHAARTERHSALLAVVAASAEELLATPDPSQRLDAMLQRIGRVTDALRVCVARLEWLPDDPLLHGWQEIAHEWSAPGVVRQMDGSLRRFAMTRADATWQRAIAQFAAERRIVATIAEQDEPFRSEQSALGVVWTLCYPILVEGQMWGLFGIDYATRFEDCDEADLAAMQTLASTIADALSRQRLEERTLEAERSRAAALRQANNELIASTSRLAALKDIPAFLDQLLLSMTRSCGARTAALFATADPDKSLRMLRCVMDDRIVSIDTDERMRLWRQPLPDWLSKAWREHLGNEAVIRAPLTGAGSPDEWADNVRWHAQFGHRLRLRFPLNVGGELVGIIVLSLLHDDAPGDFLLQQAVVLAQQAGIALQMERLARRVESSAVRTERERMAAQIHDSLAQSFTSIAMQSESLAGLLAADPDKSRVLRLIERTAREGLAEARLSVLALLPADGWPGSLDRSLETLVERSSIRGGIECRFESSGRPCAITGAAQESLLRIAQEATSNAMRHSGGTRVLIRLDYDPQRLRLTIEDDGRGLPKPEGPRQNGGFGVSGMANRAAAIGGMVTLGASALGGLVVCVELPCRAVGGADA